PRVAFLEHHQDANGVAGARVAFPLTEPAFGVLGLRDARPHVGDRRLERTRQGQLVATQGSSRFLAHAVSFFSSFLSSFLITRSAFSSWARSRLVRCTSVSSARKRRSQMAARSS